MKSEKWARAGEWMRRLIASASWEGAALDAMPLGAVVLDMPVVLVEDPSTLGVWTMSTLFVAPLADVALWLSSGSPAELADRALGALALSAEGVDIKAFEQRKDAWKGIEGVPTMGGMGQGLGAHMGIRFLMRNAANYASATLGELIELDAMRGSMAMLCARIVAKEARESEFDLAAGRAFGAIEESLGPLAFCWQNGGGRVPSAACKGPGSLLRAWPDSKEQWIWMDAARREAWELGGDLAAGPDVRGGGSRRV